MHCQHNLQVSWTLWARGYFSLLALLVFLSFHKCPLSSNITPIAVAQNSIQRACREASLPWLQSGRKATQILPNHSGPQEAGVVICWKTSCRHVRPWDPPSRCKSWSCSQTCTQLQDLLQEPTGKWNCWGQRQCRASRYETELRWWGAQLLQS